MISLETLNKFQLKEVINSERFLNLPFLPITVHRAVSHIHNPNLEDHKTTLILAWDGDELAGYMGVMGDCIVHNGKEMYVGWLSTLFVHPDFRGRKIAQQLLNKACEEYDGKILITEFTSEAENMYLKSNMFSYLKPLKGVSYHFLSNLQKILPSKNPKWNKALFVLKFCDFMINSFLNLKYKQKAFPKNDIEIKKGVDDEIERFIQQHKKPSNFKKNISEIKWITEYPWILNGENFQQKNYQFSDYDQKFEYVFIKIYKEKILKNIMMLSVRNFNDKLLFVIGENMPQTCSEALYEFVIKNKISNLISFDDGINKCFDSMNICFVKRGFVNF